jgi:hypothetical protein
MKIGRGNRSNPRKHAPAPVCPTQIPHDQTRAWTRAAAVGSQRLTFQSVSFQSINIYDNLFWTEISQCARY